MLKKLDTGSVCFDINSSLWEISIFIKVFEDISMKQVVDGLDHP